MTKVARMPPPRDAAADEFLQGSSAEGRRIRRRRGESWP